MGFAGALRHRHKLFPLIDIHAQYYTGNHDYTKMMED